MKFVLIHRYGGCLTPYKEETKCVVYESKEKLFKDLEEAVGNARFHENNCSRLRDEWMLKQPKHNTPEWNKWAEQQPDNGFHFTFAGKRFFLGAFGPVHEPIRMPEVFELDEWFNAGTVEYDE